MTPGPVTIVLMGEPVAWARTRISKRGTLFNPQKQRNNAIAMIAAAVAAMAGRRPFNSRPLRLDLEAHFAIPKGWTSLKREDALLGHLLPTKRPDLSNIVKQVEDALNHIVYRDDAMIVEYGRVRKIYSAVPKVVVTVREILPFAALVTDMKNDTLDDMIDGGSRHEGEENEEADDLPNQRPENDRS